MQNSNLKMQNENAKFKICLICVAVSFLWLVLSVGVVWEWLTDEKYILMIALLMGGTVAGVAYLGEKRCQWAARNPQTWKSLVIAGGMALAYVLVSHLSKLTVLIEFIIMANLAYLFFFSKSKNSHLETRFPSGEESSERVKEIEKQMEQCC